MITDQKLIISCQSIIHIINPAEIEYCKSDDGYTALYLTCGDEFLLCKSLTKFATELKNPFFFRIHQSYLININFLAFINKRKKFVKMKSGVEIPFSVTIKKLVSNFTDSKSEIPV